MSLNRALGLIQEKIVLGSTLEVDCLNVLQNLLNAENERYDTHIDPAATQYFAKQ